MSVKLHVETEEGYKGEIRVVVASDGTYVVRTAVYIRPKLLSPFVTVKSFRGDDAEERADKYAIHLKAAILGVGI
jgi:hypothetical protein